MPWEMNAGLVLRADSISVLCISHVCVFCSFLFQVANSTVASRGGPQQVQGVTYKLNSIFV